MMSCNKSAAFSSGSNRTSATSASAACVRAKAEAAKVRASYASQEAKLKMEKATKKAERQTREAQDKLETTRIETELELLTLCREADAAVVEAQVWEMLKKKRFYWEKEILYQIQSNDSTPVNMYSPKLIFRTSLLHHFNQCQKMNLLKN